MRKLFLQLVLISFLAGCAIFEQPFHPEFFRENPVIVPFVVKSEDEMDLLCGGKLPRNKKRLACARIPLIEKDPCFIILYYNSTEETKEHERKHCIYGRWHD
jgi:hypothetical protein